MPSPERETIVGFQEDGTYIGAIIPRGLRGKRIIAVPQPEEAIPTHRGVFVVDHAEGPFQIGGKWYYCASGHIKNNENRRNMPVSPTSSPPS